MKKTLCFVLCAVLLLTFGGCGNGEPEVPATPPTSAVTSTTTEAVTTTTTTPAEETAVTQPLWLRVPAEGEERIEWTLDTFASALCEGDVELLAWCMGQQEAAECIANGVTVTDCRVERSADGMPHRLYMNVSESAVATIPVGESEWWVEVREENNGYNLMLCPVGEDRAVWWDSIGEETHNAVYFCYQISGELELFDTVDNAAALPLDWIVEKKGTFARLHNGWLKRTNSDLGTPEMVPEEDMTAYIETILGVTVTDFGEPKHDGGEGYVFLDFPGGHWHYCRLLEHKEKGDVHTVTLRFFADWTTLVESATMKYTVKEMENNYRLLSCERLSGSDCPPLEGGT